MTAPGLFFAALLGVGAGWALGRRRRGPAAPAVPAGEGPPVLEWLLRANGGLGAWLMGAETREVAAPREGIPEELDRTVRARLEHHRMGDQQGVERLGFGTLIYASLDGRASGLLLPAESSTGVRAAALRDLARLLDFDRWRPVLAEVTRLQDRPGETAESVAFRLAHQLERLLGVETCVALVRRAGVEIAGVSLRSDQRLLRAIVEGGSPLGLVASGESEPLSGVPEPMGSVVPDRRRHGGLAYVVPIPGSGAPRGAVALWTPGGAQPEGAALIGLRDALAAAGPRLEAAIERQSLAEQATTDPLTGLRNRRGLEEAMTSVTAPSGALVYADLDHFKALNDRLGHPAGDAALKHFSDLLVRAVRDDDVVARIGGEEFAVWLPGASLERGREVAERLRQGLAYSDWRWQGEKGSLSASFGVAACPETTATREGLPRQADAALYAAKKGGRDRVVVAGSGGEVAG
ncbi:MAG TPA: GGDEF domain-containing protein [Gemmatimonadales bacterium]|nr:GGDEF domain-containing protein [Gemmatimonadales bacterium]